MRVRQWVGAAAVLMAMVAGARAEVAREALMPPGAKVLQRVHAEGVQIYVCSIPAGGTAQWRFREPLATLVADGATVGRHFAGPGWTMTDGSTVRGRVVEQAAAAESGRDIPWLWLEVVDRSGEGVLARARGILRLDTHGGVLTGACDTPGAWRLEPYSAEYAFLGD